MAEDPIGIAGGINLYAYVEGGPTLFRDPEGHNSVAEAGLIVLGGYLLGSAAGHIADFINEALNADVMRQWTEHESQRASGDARNFDANQLQRAQREQYGDIRDATIEAGHGVEQLHLRDLVRELREAGELAKPRPIEIIDLGKMRNRASADKRRRSPAAKRRPDCP